MLGNKVVKSLAGFAQKVGPSGGHGGPLLQNVTETLVNAGDFVGVALRGHPMVLLLVQSRIGSKEYQCSGLQNKVARLKGAGLYGTRQLR